MTGLLTAGGGWTAFGAATCQRDRSIDELILTDLPARGIAVGREVARVG